MITLVITIPLLMFLLIFGKRFFSSYINPVTFISLLLVFLVCADMSAALEVKTVFVIVYTVAVFTISLISTVKTIFPSFSLYTKCTSKIVCSDSLLSRSRCMVNLLGLLSTIFAILYIKLNFMPLSLFIEPQTLIQRLADIRMDISLNIKPPFMYFIYFSETYVIFATFYQLYVRRNLFAFKKNEGLMAMLVPIILIAFNEFALILTASKANFSRPITIILLVIFLRSENIFLMFIRFLRDFRIKKSVVTGLASVSLFVGLGIIAILSYSVIISRDGDIFHVLENWLRRFIYPIHYLDVLLSNPNYREPIHSSIDGLGVFLPITKLSSFLIFENQMLGAHLAPFLPLNNFVSWNTGTFAEFAFRDMGWFGLIIYPIILGTLCGVLYAHGLKCVHLSKNIWGLLPIAYACYLPWVSLSVYPLARPLVFFQITCMYIALLMPRVITANQIKHRA